MRHFFVFITFVLLSVFWVSCTEDDENGNETGENAKKGNSCESNYDCPIGFKCDLARQICTDSSENSNDGNNPDEEISENNGNQGNGNSSGNNEGGSQGSGSCKPGETKPCEYQGLPETENVGPCKAAQKTCREDGTWSECKGGYEPVFEIGDLCHDGIDNDCNGTVDDGTDLDGDGYGACSDCCESASECEGYDPKTINPDAAEISGNGVDDNCNGEVDEDPSCDAADEALAIDDYDGNAVKLAHAMGICGDQLVSATLSLAGPAAQEYIADEQCSGYSKAWRQSLPLPYYTSEYQTFAATTQYGNNIFPKEGSKMAVLATGPWNAPTQEFQCSKLSSGDMKTASKVPEDWINMMPDCTVPKSTNCGGTLVQDGLTNQCDGKEIPTVQDPVMLTLKVKVPMNARAFQFNLFFLSAEYPDTVCSSFNDFFFALLDSEHNTKYPDDEFQNPYDKNLAKDDKGNFVGIDLAPDGLFTVCKDPSNGHSNNYSSYCTKGSTLLEGTTFISMNAGSGGTDWLTTRGNVVPGEIITLRLAIFEQGTVRTYGSDHSYDSLVLLDGFKWLPQPAKAGTSQQ